MGLAYMAGYLLKRILSALCCCMVAAIFGFLLYRIIGQTSISNKRDSKFKDTRKYDNKGDKL